MFILIAVLFWYDWGTQIRVDNLSREGTDNVTLTMTRLFDRNVCLLSPSISNDFIISS